MLRAKSIGTSMVGLQSTKLLVGLKKNERKDLSLLTVYMPAHF